MYSGKNQYDRPASVNLVQNRDVIWSSEARGTVILLNANDSAETARHRWCSGMGEGGEVGGKQRPKCYKRHLRQTARSPSVVYTLLNSNETTAAAVVTTQTLFSNSLCEPKRIKWQYLLCILTVLFDERLWNRSKRNYAMYYFILVIPRPRYNSIINEKRTKCFKNKTLSYVSRAEQ